MADRDDFAEASQGDWPEGDDFLAEFSKLMRASGFGNEAAEQTAETLATTGRTEPNVPPEERMLLDDLSALTQRVITASTGLSTSPKTQITGRGGWARQTVRDWRNFNRTLVEALNSGVTTPEDVESSMSAANPEELMSRALRSLTPALGALWVGSVVGRLARVSLGSFDVPLPRRGSEGIVLNAPNIRRSAKAWGLSLEDTGLWVCLYTNILACLFALEHVSERLLGLTSQYIRTSLQFHFENIARRIGEGLLRDEGEMGNMIADPTFLLEIDEEAGREVKSELNACVGIIVAYADHMTDHLGRNMLGEHSPVPEAFKRRRLAPPQEYAAVRDLFGIDLTTDGTNKGVNFVEGVVEREGTDKLGKLWETAENWPTPSEVKAPGLWLARLELNL